MNLTGLHFLLTYQCTFECDHCFVWGSPWQQGTFTLGQVRTALQQAQDTGTVTGIYFEGGEPFLYYPILLRGVQEARKMGFSVGIVSNAYWAEDVESAEEWLRPFVGLLDGLTVSSDLFHYSEKMSRQAKNATIAAENLGISLGVICIAQPKEGGIETVGQLPEDEGAVMYRGRAAVKLVGKAGRAAWDSFTECPHEDLREPGRVHVDAYGNLHLCQGIVIGNLFQQPLKDICAQYDPEAHPIVGALLAGGPAELSRRYGAPREESYADACHLCYETRRALRERFPEQLAPDQMFGAPV